MVALPDFISTYARRVCKKIARLVSGIWFNRHFFKFLYVNFDGKDLEKTGVYNDYSETCKFKTRNRGGG